jgi:hypothetical protein
LGVVLAAMLTIVAAAVVWPRSLPVRQTARETFYLDLPFETVCRILLLSEATDDIVTLGGMGDLKEYELTQRPDWGQVIGLFASKRSLQAKATMQLQTVDEEYVGSHLITLKQDVDIHHDSLHSTIELEKGTDRLHDYENTTRFLPDGERTKVETAITLDILVTAPNFAHNYAVERVRANAERKVANQIGAIRQIIETNKDKPLISLPFGG